MVTVDSVILPVSRTATTGQSPQLATGTRFVIQRRQPVGSYGMTKSGTPVWVLICQKIKWQHEKETAAAAITSISDLPMSRPALA